MTEMRLTPMSKINWKFDGSMALFVQVQGYIIRLEQYYWLVPFQNSVENLNTNFNE